MSASLFQGLLGPAFDRLPLAIRQVHVGASHLKMRGASSIERAHSWLGRKIAALAGLPTAGAQVDLRVTIEVAGPTEQWTRHFGPHTFHSQLQAEGGYLVERLGPVAIVFELAGDSQQLRWIPRGGRLLGMALPSRFFACVAAVETMSEGRYCFDVRAALPIIGLIIHYRGWLRPDG